MRPALSLTLVALAAFAAARPAPCQAGWPFRPLRAESVGATPLQPRAAFEVKGYGPDAAAAEQNAFEKAQREVADWLARNRPDIDWAPSAEYLRQHGMARTLEEPRDFPIQPVGGFNILKEVRLDVEIRDQNLREMAQVARHHRMEQRQAWAGYGLAGAVALLLVTGGVLHLEEWTRGYYRRRLRVGAVVLLLIVIALGLVVIG